jgi:hypothetical protein
MPAPGLKESTVCENAGRDKINAAANVTASPDEACNRASRENGLAIIRVVLFENRPSGFRLNRNELERRGDAVFLSVGCASAFPLPGLESPATGD